MTMVTESGPFSRQNCLDLAQKCKPKTPQTWSEHFPNVLPSRRIAQAISITIPELINLELVNTFVKTVAVFFSPSSQVYGSLPSRVLFFCFGHVYNALTRVIEVSRAR